ncbi:MAG: hypothetical protein A2268_00640 [Candidatus Raymondbacteria bacterium RifOxyA12_full_50_37]|uniref:Uncharacterized protein n=1 Tax=Candidatus Raymondbacteria bacterium RIFOXYD12_FULL_49_13 TaxID=1817890 RepID=A0A1F7F164_UNCRA|nr:MAG: hypothetical protein A2350_20415 [Candidatus Raymondbacteria bacterium RifOxyB12_full_50_8]OGJ90664.1 MAG: hypothetical protein A2268_00640 [Candidatus Raymondbacteria bacterium RifOxyA12_full_50_37]OGJ92007.1 MAG: hypothetical protein A2248_15700 [Candidatus Raymondbacteria bacterium RIFOXYA2_FULL_49_16]OGK00400.1 MAG: hypothetical protein A2519_01195 [Candidatus Raymondbacteria bacterium RIFOXYD12_FULL_49_13]OGK04806.1 MAG: hypothetical protein A2487_11545 [Candidatus Raymondbacteria 
MIAQLHAILIINSIVVMGLAAGVYCENVIWQVIENGENRDSLVFLDPEEPGSDFYHTIKIYREGKQVFSHSDFDKMYIGTPKALVTNFYNRDKKRIEYIIKCGEGSDLPSFLVITSKDKLVEIFGYSLNNSADIFGDIDLDGYFEIGGIVALMDGIKEKPVYRVLKIKDTFVSDTILEQCLYSIYSRKKN